MASHQLDGLAKVRAEFLSPRKAKNIIFALLMTIYHSFPTLKKAQTQKVQAPAKADNIVLEWYFLDTDSENTIFILFVLVIGCLSDNYPGDKAHDPCW